MNENQICPKCGEELVQCENCENVGCPDCDGYVTTPDEVLLCAKCTAALKAEWDEHTANGTKICGTCVHFKDEDADGDGWCEEDDWGWNRQHYCQHHAPRSNEQQENNEMQEA